MKTGLKKSQKTTEIYFDEASPWITVSTYNTNPKNRLTAYSEKYPKLCKQTDDTEDVGLTFVSLMIYIPCKANAVIRLLSFQP